MSDTTSDVINTLNRSLSRIEAEESDLAGGVRAVIPDEEIGQAMAVLRRSGYEFEAKRDPSGENLVVNIDAEEREGLGELFG
jgi:hypothetical protein